MNWNSLTYRQKNKVVAAACLLFLVVVYQFAISNTWNLYTQNNILSKKLAVSKEFSGNREEVEFKRNVLEQKMTTFFVDSLNHQDLLIETLSRYCAAHSVLLKELPAMTSSQVGSFMIGTYKVVLEGGYHNLLKLVYLLEQKNKIGRISSVSFQYKFDNKRKRNILNMCIYIQNIQLYENKI